MKRILILLITLVFSGGLEAAPASPAALRASSPLTASEHRSTVSSSLGNARRAQVLLGPELWSCVIRVANTAARSRYPATVFALVFEEAGLLWFYTDADGTQSLTLHPDRLTEEKADLTPLLRAIEPGFSAYEVLAANGERTSRSIAEDGPGGPFSAAEHPLPNGCFVESLAALGACVRRGEPIERARLLNCYVNTPNGLRGHTVLTYETPRGLFLLDAGRSLGPRSMPRAWADNAMALAGAALEGSRVTRARWVPTALPLPAAAVASLDFPNDSGPGAAPRLMP